MIFESTPQFFADQSNNIASQNRAVSGVASRQQRISVTDVISEGPIQGLVGGGAGVYLDDDSMFPQVSSGISAAINQLQVTLTNGASTITFNPTIPQGQPEQSMRVLSVRAVDTTTILSVGSVTTDDNGRQSVPLTTLSTFFTDKMIRNGGMEAARLKIDALNLSIPGYIVSRTSGTVASFVPMNADTANLENFRSQQTSQTVILEIDYTIQVQTATVTPYLVGNWEYDSGTYDADLSNAFYYDFGDDDVYARDPNTGKFAKANIEFRAGTLNQPPISSMYGTNGTSIPNASFSPQSLEFIDGNSQTTGIAASPPVLQGSASAGFNLSAAQLEEVDAVRIQISYSSLSSTGQEGETREAGARYKIEFIPIINGTDQTAIHIADRVHGGKFPSPVSFQEIIQLEQYRPFTDFKVKITRLTRFDGRQIDATGQEGGANNKMQAQATISSVQSHISESLNYPFTALAKVDFSSKDYQAMPVRTYHCRGLKVKIPSNYTTRENSAATNPDVSDLYNGLWNGNFKSVPEYTDNPAWIFYDIVTNNRYGIGDYVKESDIDKYALYRIARYCDERVDDFKGGTEPRYRANIYLTKHTDVYKVLKDFATVFVGILYWQDGKITAVQDSPSDPVYTFTKSNVINGQFEYQTSSKKVRPNQLTVMWTNPEANYRLEPLLIEDRENIAKTGTIVREKAVAFGCTSEGQAIRFGRWKLWTAINQTEILGFSTSINASFLAPGDVIKVQDADEYNIAYSGRVINSSSTTSIVLDRNVTIQSGKVYKLSLVFEDPDVEDGDATGHKNTKIVQETITNSAGSTSTLTVASSDAFPSAPPAGAIWMLLIENSDGTRIDGSEKEYKIVGITEDDKQAYSITAIQYFEEKYDAIENDEFSLVIERSITPSYYADGEIYAPANLYLFEAPDPLKAGNEVRVVWDFPVDDDGGLAINVRSFEIFHNIVTQESPITVAADTTEILLENVPDQKLKVSVRTIDTVGRRSSMTPAQIKVQDKFPIKCARSKQGLPVGGTSASKLLLDSNFDLDFEGSTVLFAAAGSPTSVYSNTVAAVDTIDSTIADGDTNFILFDSSAQALKTIKFVDNPTFKTPYWKDVIANNDFDSGAGTVSVSKGSNKVTGSSTNFDGEYVAGQIIKFNSTQAAVVTHVVNDTHLRIDRSFDTAISGSAHEYNTLLIDFEADTIVAETTKSADGTSSTFKSLISIDTTLEGPAGVAGSSINLVFTRKATAPTATGTGGLPTDGTSSPATWADNPPTGTDPLWAVKGQLNTTTNQWSWGTPYRVDGNAVAEVYFYSNATTGAAPAFSAPTYNFTNNDYTAPTNWNKAPPSLTADGEKIYVIVVLYASTPGDTAATADTTSAAVIYAQRTDGSPGSPGVSYTGTTEYYRLTNSTTPPGRYSSGTTIDTNNWSTSPQTPTSTNQYLWNFNRNSRSNSTFDDSAVTLITQFVEDGVGISSIGEEYQRGSSATNAPTGTWYSTFSDAGALTEALPYMWNKTTITFTDSTTTVLTTLIAVRGDNGDPGDDGDPGVAFFNLDIDTTTAASDVSLVTNARVLAVLGRYAIVGDIAVVSTNNAATPSYGWKCTAAQSASSNGTWTAAASFISGDLIVDGSIGASEIAANSITSNELLIASTTGGGIRMTDTDGNGNTTGAKIEIYDNATTPVLRVKIGYLGT